METGSEESRIEPERTESDRHARIAAGRRAYLSALAVSAAMPWLFAGALVLVRWARPRSTRRVPILSVLPHAGGPDDPSAQLQVLGVFAAISIAVAVGSREAMGQLRSLPADGPTEPRTIEEGASLQAGAAAHIMLCFMMSTTALLFALGAMTRSDPPGWSPPTAVALLWLLLHAFLVLETARTGSRLRWAMDLSRRTTPADLRSRLGRAAPRASRGDRPEPSTVPWGIGIALATAALAVCLGQTSAAVLVLASAALATILISFVLDRFLRDALLEFGAARGMLFIAGAALCLVLFAAMWGSVLVAAVSARDTLMTSPALFAVLGALDSLALTVLTAIRAAGIAGCGPFRARALWWIREASLGDHCDRPSFWKRLRARAVLGLPAVGAALAVALVVVRLCRLGWFVGVVLVAAAIAIALAALGIVRDRRVRAANVSARTPQRGSAWSPSHALDTLARAHRADASTWLDSRLRMFAPEYRTGPDATTNRERARTAILHTVSGSLPPAS